MLIYDTNVLYAAVGLSSNEKFDETLLTKHRSCVATPTLFEAVARYRDDPSKLRRCLWPIYTLQYSLISISNAQLSNEEISRLLDPGRWLLYQQTCTYVVERKMELEARLLQIVFLVLATALLDTIAKRLSVMRSEAEVEVQAMLFRALMESSAVDVYERFRGVLDAGYNSKVSNADKAVRTVMVEQLDALALLFRRECKLASSLLESTDWEKSLEECKGIFRDESVLERSLASVDPMKPTQAKQFRKANEDLVGAVTVALGQDRLGTSGARYLAARLHNILQAGAVFRKNDTFDLMIACASDLDDSIIVTLDGGFAKALKTSHPTSYQFNVQHGFVS